MLNPPAFHSFKFFVTILQLLCPCDIFQHFHIHFMLNCYMFSSILIWIPGVLQSWTTCGFTIDIGCGCAWVSHTQPAFNSRFINLPFAYFFMPHAHLVTHWYFFNIICLKFHSVNWAILTFNLCHFSNSLALPRLIFQLPVLVAADKFAASLIKAQCCLGLALQGEMCLTKFVMLYTLRIPWIALFVN